jgi:hypothetical protein
VRSVLHRELTGPDDWQLLCLERMRLVDMAHYWALGTHKVYKSKLAVLRNFETNYGLCFLKPTALLRPPSGPEIPLMWCQEAYSLRPGSSRRISGDAALTPAFTTIRGLRSAASQYFAWDMMISNPATVLDAHQRVLLQPCRPTDSIGCSFHAGGMSSRIGNEAQPSLPLLDCHVRSLDADLDRRYLLATTPLARRNLALAGFAHLTLWLGWLRSSEVFGLTWQDLLVILRMMVTEVTAAVEEALVLARQNAAIVEYEMSHACWGRTRQACLSSHQRYGRYEG